MKLSAAFYGVRFVRCFSVRFLHSKPCDTLRPAATAGTPKTATEIATAATKSATPAAAAAAATSAITATPPATSVAEIEQLQQALIEKQTQLYALETACLRETERQVELEDSVIAWQDKYDRLYESHKRVQKVNQSLEDKMLKLVDRNAGERAQLTSDVATLSVRLAQANFNIAKLQREIERYKADISLAIQLLQCKPDSFVSQKVSSLPIDIQSKVSAYMRLETNSHSDSECSNSGVGVATTASYKVLPASDSPPPSACPFPPTAMVYSMRGIDAANGNSATNPQQQSNQANNNNISNNTKDTINNNNTNNNNNTTNSNGKCNNQTNTNISNNNNANQAANPDMISPTIMAKFLEAELKANEVKHCDTCQCSKQDLQVLADVSRSYSVATQTPHQLQLQGSGLNEPLTQLCLRCHSNLNSPSRTNSPYLMKMVKSSDSVISETKSSVSDLNDMDKLFTPAKKDDLMVNPILGHHRLCDRTSLPGQNAEFGNGKLTTSTMMYPTTHLGAYAAEKYLLETSNLGQLRNGYQRRFLDGGGTALQLLNKYEAGAVGVVQDELEDESSKPLLSGVSQPSLLEAEQAPPQLTVAPVKLEDVCEPLPTKPVAPAAPPGNTSAAAPSGTQLKSTNSGSVQSLWSNKTSSCEGAKMFETFNRNLIKTIKAENPKYRGPRLCAMRIQQNGQSNILLDNLESIETYTPVIYKRREKLLDEELNDGKDIITSKESNAQSAVEAWQGPAAPHENVALQPVLEPQVEIPEVEQAEIKPGVSTTNPGVNSPKHSANSSSISDAIDYQESVLLRRQQLSRVAEWVQHNTQQLEQRSLQQAPPTSDSNSGTERQSSYSTLDRMDSISIEKLSMDSGYKTTPQQLTNGYPEKSTEDSLSPKTDITSNSMPENPSGSAVPPKKMEMCTTYYRRTTRSGLPVAYTTISGGQDDSSPPGESTSSGSEALICPEQPTCDILNYKYYPNDTDKTRSVQAELHTTTQNVDIAQMEYNVKQFLLKQNEWSMNGGGSSGKGANPGLVVQGSGAARMLQRRILGPGVGERVRMATPGGAVATKATVTATATTTATQSSNILPPHRTETNL
ncbi:ras guanine nucleotide exchange factor B isoform X2 [Drosophila eugracilis]|uniref:ras guanine nucleotide exchange factor B isoform X2 n=1 Tax=Drosophila eugracilis TaxID=29029 RepID=UPI0007E81EFE|nr:ras guanine nucleotide exchange factor B isoform X2 [Drosophila eugracilis]